MTEFQGAILLGQIGSRRSTEHDARDQCKASHRAFGTAGHLPREDVRRLHPQCVPSLHVPLRRGEIRRAPARRILKALSAEGIPGSTGYKKLNKEQYIIDRVTSRPFINVYGKQRIDDYLARIECPQNDKLTEELVWFTQNMLLGPESDMDQIADAIEKIHAHAAEIASAYN